MHARFRRCLLATAALLGASLLPLTATGATPAGASSGRLTPSISITPAKGLRSGQVVTITVSGEPAGATLLALECTPAAVSIGEDGCANRLNAVFFGTSSARVRARLAVVATITTAVGTTRCGTSGCLLAVVRLTAGNADSIVGIAAISFAASAGRSPAGHGPPAPAPWATPKGVGVGDLVTAAHPDSSTVEAGVAGDLSADGAVTGPGVSLPAIAPPAIAETGVGLLQLVLAAPGTSWASSTRTAVVVDVTVDKEPTQQVVCFAGARAFTYALALGSMATGRHHLTVAVDTSLSTTGRAPPVARVVAARPSSSLPTIPPTSRWPTPRSSTAGRTPPRATRHCSPSTGSPPSPARRRGRSASPTRRSGRRRTRGRASCPGSSGASGAGWPTSPRRSRSRSAPRARSSTRCTTRAAARRATR